VAWWHNKILAVRAVEKVNSAEASNMARFGMPPSLRGALWMTLSGGKTLLQNTPDLYQRALAARFGDLALGVSPDSSAEAVPPSFGSTFEVRRVFDGCENASALSASHHRVTACLAQRFPRGLQQPIFLGFPMLVGSFVVLVEPPPYCPWLPMFVAVALLYLTEREVFAFVAALLPRWLMKSRREAWLMAAVFESLVEKLQPRVLQAAKQLLPGDNVFFGVVQHWVGDCLPVPALLVLVDNFVVKGPKIFYRVGLALFQSWLGLVELTQSLPPIHGRLVSFPSIADVARDVSVPMAFFRLAFSFKSVCGVPSLLERLKIFVCGRFSHVDIAQALQSANLAAWRMLDGAERLG
jgi:hypothetical protein